MISYQYIFLPIYIVVFLALFFYVRIKILSQGFNMIVMFVLTYSLFYLLVPFVHTYSKKNRSNDALFTNLLNMLPDEEIFFNFLLAFFFLILVIISYSVYGNKKNIKNDENKDFKVRYKNIEKYLVITNLIMILTSISIVLLIRETGSISNYLNLGTLTRGLDKDTSYYIRSSFLQLVTLSKIVLVTPYLYLFIYRATKEKKVLLGFIYSMFFANLYLLHNQGRAPLIIFYLPFILVSKKPSKKDIYKLLILLLGVIVSLNIINAMFKFLAYDYFLIEETNYVQTFLQEFSYPFANFSLRNQLIDIIDYRLGVDYISWILTMIPESLLRLVGISKSNWTAILFENTLAYSFLTGRKASGGIPVDFLTVHYYQLGYLSIVIASIVVGRILRYLDRIFDFFKRSYPIKILLYRMSFSVINILNNNDLSAIFRNRLDVVVLTIFIIYIYIEEKKKENMI